MPSDRVKRHINRLLDEADEAVARLEWDVVRDRSQAVLDLDPQNEDAQGLRAAADRALARTGAQVVAPAGAQRLATTPESQPASFAGGRDEVKRFLGEGGKKKVYLDHDTLLDREVAFALIKTEGLDEAGRTRIQRQAQAMGRLGSHPHIVTVFDLGQHPATDSGQASQPYMVTELMGGGDVEGLIEKAEDHRLALEQAEKSVSRGIYMAQDGAGNGNS